MIRFLAVDGNTIGLGGLSGALVVAMGQLLRDRRDSDKRVDRASTELITEIRSQRDDARHELTEARDRILELESQVNVLQLRLGLRGEP